MLRPYSQFIILTCLLLIVGCKSKKKQEPVVSEGIVKYKISYSTDISKRSFSFLLPNKMNYYFRPGQERISFEGNMGLYMLDFISNHGSNSSSILLKILNNKMYVPPSDSRNLFIFESLRENQVILHKDPVREILGYEARKATIKLNSDVNADITIWYTPEISTSSTNKNTPFSDVPGVMLEFSIYYNNVLFTLKSQSIEKIEQGDEIFQIPDEYRVSTAKEIEEMVAGIIN